MQHGISQIKEFNIVNFVIILFRENSNGTTIVRGAREFGRVRGPIHLDGISCTGSEASLSECYQSDDPSDCSHYEDIGVSCFDVE